MSRKQVSISETSFQCPITGKTCRVAVKLLFRPDDIMQHALNEPDGACERALAIEEAKRHG